MLKIGEGHKHRHLVAQARLPYDNKAEDSTKPARDYYMNGACAMWAPLG